MKIKINNQEIEVRNGETLIEVARGMGCKISSLCYAKDAKHKSSCMVCAVKNCVTGQIIPSCTTMPTEGMQIDTDCDEVKQIRTLSLELLLSDHRADCEAPCSVACPAGFDVAMMNRLYDQGKKEEALYFLRNGLVIPATLCYICNAPCEKICRKGEINEAVKIREIKKELVSSTQIDKIKPLTKNGEKIAIIGSDPAGLSAAYHLCKAGYKVTVFKKSDSILTSHIDAEKVPADILDLEIEVLKRLGILFVTSCENPELIEFAAIIATAYDNPKPEWLTLSTKTKQPARLVLEGRKLAEKLIESLRDSNESVVEEKTLFNSKFLKLTEVEKQSIISQEKTIENKTECLYCDCEKKADCRLREIATEYGIKNTRYTKDSTFDALQRQHVKGNIWFEQAKCIRCGLCVYNTDNGFTFKDRGYGMEIVIPEESKGNIDDKVVELCPTGALYIKK